jgi:hypothetical protein
VALTADVLAWLAVVAVNPAERDFRAAFKAAGRSTGSMLAR